MRIKELEETAEREYVNLPKEDIERLRQKFLPDWDSNVIGKHSYLYPGTSLAYNFIHF